MKRQSKTTVLIDLNSPVMWSASKSTLSLALQSSQPYFNLYFNLLSQAENMFVAADCIILRREEKYDARGVAWFLDN